MLKTLLFLGVLAQVGHATQTKKLYGVGYIGITVEDLEISTDFYTKVLGGKYLEELQPEGGVLYGDEHYNQMFGKEIADAANQGVDPVELGVPDISDTGDYQVRFRFIVLGNTMVQLIKYERRSDSQVFNYRHPSTSPAYLTQMHIAFWMQENVNANDYVLAVEDKCRNLGVPVFFNTPVTVHNRTELENVPDHLRTAGNPAKGMSWVYFKGPAEEQLEGQQVREPTRSRFAEVYCKRKAVSPTYVTDYEDNQYQINAGETGKLYGIKHFGINVDDLAVAQHFYGTVLGGDFLPHLSAQNVRGDGFQNMIFTKEILEAIERGIDFRDFGIAPVASNDNGRFDNQKFLFDNLVVEIVAYTDGPHLSDPSFSSRFNSSTPAAIGSMQLGFHVDENVHLDKFLEDLEGEITRPGNQGTGSSGTSSAILSGGMEGYQYANFKGPAGEQLVFYQFKGISKEILKAGLIDYNSTSKAFAETDPFKTGAMKEVCQQFTEDEEDEEK